MYWIVFGVVVVFLILIFTLGSKTTGPNKLEQKEANDKEDLDIIAKEHKLIKTAIMDYKKENNVMPNHVKELADYLKEPIHENLYSLSVDKKHLIVYGIEEERAKKIINSLGTDSYYEGNILYLGFIKLKRSDIEPVAVISMRPESNITTTTYIEWGYKESVTEDRIIIDHQWENKSEFYESPGEQIVRLRVQDKYNNWSNWVEKRFEVTEEKGFKFIQGAKNMFFKVTKSGNTESYYRIDEKDKLSAYEKREIIRKEHIASIGGGLAHVACVQHSGKVYTFGKNKYGQLGNGTTTDSLEFIKVENIYDGRRIFAGDYMTFATTHSGKVFGWGKNEEGQLGDGTQITRMTPAEIKGLPPISKIVASDNHVAALAYSGVIYMWGVNKYGQLGDGTRGNKKTPIILDLKHIKDIAVGKDFTLALAETGKVFSWGHNECFQLGKGNNVDESLPTEIRNLTDIVAICTDKYYTLALSKTGKVYYWGADNEGNAISRTPKEMTNLGIVQMIAINPTDVFAMNYDGEVSYWKKGFESQLQTL